MASDDSIPSSIENRMRLLLSRWLPACDFEPLPRFGPGACAERLSQNRRRQLLSRLKDYLSDGNYFRGGMDTSDPLICHQRARLCAVPKDWNKRRLITVEPLVSTMLQQMARSYMIECMRNGPLSKGPWRDFFSYMPSHQRMVALRSSYTREYATVDLSDASDRISYTNVARVFPTHVLAWLDVSRTPFVECPCGNIHPLHIYAGMGNATTFLVETLFFMALCTAVKQLSGLHGQITVFGDDIIMPSILYERQFRGTEYPFFKINSLKSYGLHTSFRESCGIFAYKGIDVTAQKITGAIGADAGLVLADLWHRLRASHWLEDQRLAFTVASDCRVINTPSPTPYSVSEGGLPYSELPVRLNKAYQRIEYRFPYSRPRYRLLAADKQWMLDSWFIGQAYTTYRSRKRHGTVTNTCYWAQPLDGSYSDHLWVAP
nr:MAG: hypothetical protein 3 [Leviviridae sp.]